MPVLTAPSTQGGASGTAGSPPAVWARACSRAAPVPHGRVGGRGSGAACHVRSITGEPLGRRSAGTLLQDLQTHIEAAEAFERLVLSGLEPAHA